MSNVKNYNDKQLIARAKSIKNFIDIPEDFWILGVRSQEDENNMFDDKFYIFKGETFVMVTSGTTNPGQDALGKPMNKEGAFVIKADHWHYDLWKHGVHKGKMPALVQNSKVVGYRDNDRDKLSEEIGTLVAGFYGINFHASTYNFANTVVTRLIGGWSHGCQVCNNRPHYNRILELLKGQKTVTYCLLKEF